MTKIKCNCIDDKRGNKQGADFQNKVYGQGIRIATEKQKPIQGQPQVYVCTVCGTSTTKKEH